MVHGAWCMAHGAWRMVHGAWCMVHGACAQVALLPEGDLQQTSARWREMGPLLAKSTWPEFVSNADGMSPVNGGVFLVKPSATRYDKGLVSK